MRRERVRGNERKKERRGKDSKSLRESESKSVREKEIQRRLPRKHEPGYGLLHLISPGASFLRSIN